MLEEGRKEGREDVGGVEECRSDGNGERKSEDGRRRMKGRKEKERDGM